MSDKGNPISMRISDPVLDSLKKEARKISFESDKDTSYVDLIRHAIEKYINEITHYSDNPVEIEVEEQEKSTEDISNLFPDLTAKEMLKLCGIDLDNPLAKKIAKIYTDHIRTNSLSRKLLKVKNLKYGEAILYERNPACVAHVIARRGAVPDQICEGSQVHVPTFEIAAHPSIRLCEILSGRTQIFAQSADSGGSAMAREEDINVINVLKSAASTSKNCVEYSGNITMGHVEKSYMSIARNSVIPTHLVCNNVTLINLQNTFAGSQGDWEFKINSKNPTCGGHYRNAEIHISDRIVDGEIVLSADAEKVGRFGEIGDPIVLLYPDVAKLRVSYVVFETISLAVLNDYTVAHIYPSKEDKKQ